MMLFMKRRNFVRALVAAPVAPVLLAQQPAPAPAPAEAAKLETAVAEEAAEPLPHFFSKAQLDALRKLCELLTPGALDAGAPEFLDFYLGVSGADRQHIYRAGLDALNTRGFAEVDALLRAPWTYEEPADPLARFLRVAKVDVRTATMNSKQNSANAATGRRGGGTGMYWYPL
jgi:hypothetical protein